MTDNEWLQLKGWLTKSPKTTEELRQWTEQTMALVNEIDRLRQEEARNTTDPTTMTPYLQYEVSINGPTPSTLRRLTGRPAYVQAMSETINQQFTVTVPLGRTGYGKTTELILATILVNLLGGIWTADAVPMAGGE